MPLPKVFEHQQTERKIRDIDTKAPIIFKDTNETLLRLNKDLIHIDSVNHVNGMIHKSIYANEIGKVLSIDLYSDVFIVYNDDCKMEKTFKPTSQQLMGQVCMDLFWSDR